MLDGNRPLPCPTGGLERMPDWNWLRNLLRDLERQQEELKRLKSRSEELLHEPREERRVATVPVHVERRKRRNNS